jgi:hypothetical protein
MEANAAEAKDPAEPRADLTLTPILNDKVGARSRPLRCGRRRSVQRIVVVDAKSAESHR